MLTVKQRYEIGSRIQPRLGKKSALISSQEQEYYNKKEKQKEKWERQVEDEEEEEKGLHRRKGTGHLL